MKEALKLTDHELFSSRNDENGQEAAAIFYVYASHGEEPARAYSLTVMNETAYDEWFFELSYNDDPEMRAQPVPFPLIVPESVAAEGLYNFVKSRYLDPNNPTDI